MRRSQYIYRNTNYFILCYSRHCNSICVKLCIYIYWNTNLILYYYRRSINYVDSTQFNMTLNRSKMKYVIGPFQNIDINKYTNK